MTYIISGASMVAQCVKLLGSEQHIDHSEAMFCSTRSNIFLPKVNRLSEGWREVTDGGTTKPRPQASKTQLSLSQCSLASAAGLTVNSGREQRTRRLRASFVC